MQISVFAYFIVGLTVAPRLHLGHTSKLIKMLREDPKAKYDKKSHKKGWP